jgi:hypothetical protein
MRDHRATNVRQKLNWDNTTVLNRTKTKTKDARRQSTCEAAVSLLDEYLAGNLTSPVQSAFDLHLSQCQDCEAFLKTYKKTIEVTQEFLKMQAPQNRLRKFRLRSIRSDRSLG